MQKLLFNVSVALLVINAATAPALAQCAETNIRRTAQPGFIAAQPARPARLPTLPDIGRPYFMSVTTGIVTNAGFERCLTDRDPSLRHWTWIPVTSFVHKTIGRGQPGAGMPQRPEHVYVKPNHVPLPIVDHGSQVVMAPGSHYVKPIHVPLPVVDNGQFAVAQRAPVSAGNVSGRLVMHKRNPLNVEKAIAKTYGTGYGDTYGHLCSSTGDPHSEQLRVNARLMAAH
jgi:hypothetical protein